MARRRFFVPSIRAGQAALQGPEARRLMRVLRAQVGQRFELSDNHSVCLAEIEAITEDQVRFRVLEPLPPEAPRLHVTLFAALVKFERFEWMLEKATELGVAAMVPILAERSEKGLELAARKRLQRWRKIAIEASQQARRARLPELLPPASFAQAVAHSSPYRYFLEEQPGPPPLAAALPPHRQASDTVALLVGPEGGWTDPERALAAQAGWVSVSLGPHILRTETAALAALAILSSAWSALPS
jgi:16S rRNA (uracil1498-N3)-methyltransferase